MTTTRHGTLTGYWQDGCRCDACRAAIAHHQNVYQLRRIANGGRPLMVPKLGAVRRLHALMALGWPRRELARQAGYASDAFAPILNNRGRGLLFPETHQRVCDLYERLCMTPGPSALTAAYAARQGWLPPLAWDDGELDDPAAEPTLPVDRLDHHAVDHAVVERILAGEWRLKATRGEKRAVAARWVAAGRSTYDLEALTGWNHAAYKTSRVEREPA